MVSEEIQNEFSRKLFGISHITLVIIIRCSQIRVKQKLLPIAVT